MEVLVGVLDTEEVLVLLVVLELVLELEVLLVVPIEETLQVFAVPSASFESILLSTAGSTSAKT